MQLTILTACAKFLARAQQMFTITVSEKVLHWLDNIDGWGDGVLFVFYSMEHSFIYSMQVQGASGIDSRFLKLSPVSAVRS
jgi:hypothetical protein